MAARAQSSSDPSAAAGTGGKGSGHQARNASPVRQWRVRAEEAHKHDQQNLWLGTARLDELGRFTVTFSIPEGQAAVRFVDLIEIERQAGIVFAHSYLEVAADAVFVLSEISLNADPTWRAHSGFAGEIEVSRADPVAPRQASSRKVAMRFHFRIDGNSFAHGFARVSFLPPALYARVRTRAGANPICESPGGHRSPGAAIIDLLDPLTADHRTDHVPGMAVAAAIEKAVTGESGGRPLRMLSLRFQSYIEHDPPPLLRVDPLDGNGIRGHLEQGNVVKGTFTAALTEPT
ncbi:hotdog family protein [Herbiconiux ginsengi]|uniref:A-factor biosynthesis hotdog domain-containing protein n=1 Tax=Herbiconiux ginsengi TaxID=381665 RepID=A0A1H3TZ11_9MICO|nr:AfsA-related hotdog domain-containing protein [Herbiconiux ginsengi]SDZ55318.1 A-factor biosynthesis hotdog domain-containing protein [Herbiconiux ginsengi]